MNINDYGIVPNTENLPGIPARVTAQHKERYEIVCEHGITHGMWEHYVVNWCGKRNWEEGASPEWIKTWEDMYFDYRRQYEGRALFVLREMKEIAK